MSIRSELLKLKIVRSYIDKKTYKSEISKYSDVVGELKKYKGIYAGKRCFVIGTGPSLKASDLDKLYENNEICFASNRIYEIFDQTKWRPTYYANQDVPLIKKTFDKIKQIECCKFLPTYVFDLFKEDQNTEFFVLKHKDYYPKDAEFSFDICDYIGQGFTVTYGLIQIAAYMGFKEIYLLGIDHNYAVSLNEKGVPVYSDTKDYFEGSNASNQGINLPRVVESTVAYMTAEKIAEKNGFKVFNATRGGKLDAFPRVDFDSLF